MYDNIGEKIKGLAKWTFIVEAIAAVITGIAMMMVGEGEELSFYGLLVMLLGPIAAWVSSWLLYGFGEIITKLCDIERNTRGAVNVDSDAFDNGYANEQPVYNSEVDIRSNSKQKSSTAENFYKSGSTQWSFEENTGNLTIVGNGKIDSYNDAFSSAPWSFYRSQIVSVTIKEGVTNIGDCAFSSCSSLTSIEIPASVTSIGYLAFSGCSSLTSINYSGTQEQWNKIDNIENASISKNCTIHCTDGDIVT